MHLNKMVAQTFINYINVSAGLPNQYLDINK